MRHTQLGLFSREQMSAMRDRTRARNWSPEKDEFRREHARRRAWGLAQRHGLKRMRLRREERLAREADSRPTESQGQPSCDAGAGPAARDRRAERCAGPEPATPDRRAELRAGLKPATRDRRAEWRAGPEPATPDRR